MSASGILGLLVGFGGTLLLTPCVRALAQRIGAVDDPQSAPDRKKQLHPIPRFGGVAIAATLFLGGLIGYRYGILPGPDVSSQALVGLMVAVASIVFFGVIDDRYSWSARWQLLGPIVAALSVVLFGVGVRYLANPFGGLLWLDTWQATIAGMQIPLLGGLVTWLWLMGTMYTTKILDGVDGLVSGIGVIGAVIIFALTLRPEVQQPSVGYLAMLFAGACLGFLFYNWQPASIYLGESGSVLIGFFLGILAVISGGKIATALLILGLPILDLAFVILYRRFILHRSPFSRGDRAHLHFRLLDAGFSVRQTVLTLYSVTFLFGISTLLVPGKWKLFILVLLSVGTFAFAWRLAKRHHA